VPLVETEVEDKPHVGSVALDIEVVTAQLSVTVPENELPAVTVIVEVAELLRPTRMLPLLVNVKLLLVGASQKPAQPVRKQVKNGAVASNNFVQLPILIAAPFAPFSRRVFFNIPFSGYRSATLPVSQDERTPQPSAIKTHPSDDSLISPREQRGGASPPSSSAQATSW